MAEQELQILLIDDDPDDALIIHDLLEDIERVKLVFTWAPTYQEGIQKINDARWNAVLVDYDLGGKNGLELIREAAAQDVKAPMIMVTGRGRYEIDLEASEAGAADYVSKDQLNSSFLERTIRHAIERRRVEEELERRVQERTRELHILLTLFEGLFNASPDAILLTNAQGIIEKANPLVEALFGYLEDELAGKPVETLIPTRYHSAHLRHRSDYMQDPHTRPMGVGLSLSGLAKDGREFPVDVKLSPLTVGQQTYVIVVVRDLSAPPRPASH